MISSFIVGMVIGILVNYILLSNLKKLTIFTRSKLLLFIIAIVLLLIYTSLQTLFGFGKIIPTVFGGIITPIYMMIFIYLIMSRKNVNKN